MPGFAGGGRLIKPPLQHILYGQNTPSAVTPHQIYTRSACQSHKTNKIVDEQARYAKLTTAALKMHLGVPACSQKHCGSLQLTEGMRHLVAAAGVTQSDDIGGSGQQFYTRRRPCFSRFLTARAQPQREFLHLIFPVAV